MQDDYDIYYEQRRQIERHGGGWGGPLIAAVLVAIVTGILLYANRPPENVETFTVRFVIAGSADQGHVRYGIDDDVPVERNVGLPWELTLNYDRPPQQLTLQIDDVAPTDDIIRCQLWLDGALIVTMPLNEQGTALCEAIP